MMKAFVDATPAADLKVARSRSIKSVDKKIKNMRSRHNDASKDLKKTGLSTAEKDDILFKFGRCVLFGFCRSAFKGCPVSAQTSACDAVLFGSARAADGARASAGASSRAAVAGGAAGEAGETEGNGRDGDEGTNVGGSDDGDRSGVDDGESDNSEDSGRDGSMVSPGEKTAAETSAASPTNKAKKMKTSAAVRNYF